MRERHQIVASIPAELKTRIRIRAAERGHSMVQEVSEILQKEFGDEKKSTQPSPYSE